MTQIISVHSFRGGTGKSNITANIAATLVGKGHKVGVFDTDIQSPGIHVIFNVNEDHLRYTLNDYLWGKCRIEEAAHLVDLGLPGELHLVPSSIKANSIARILREGYDVNLLNEGFRDLNQALDLDFLLIDSHPGLNEETLLSIAVSDVLVIIMRPDQQDFQGTSVTVDVARRLNVPSIHLVVNKVPSEYNFDDIRQKVEANYGAPVAALLPLSLDVAVAASSRVFCLHEPDHAFSQGVKAVVDGLYEVA